MASRHPSTVTVLPFVDLSLSSNEQHLSRVLTAKIQSRLEELVEQGDSGSADDEERPVSGGLRKVLARIAKPTPTETSTEASPSSSSDSEGSLQAANRIENLGAGAEVAYVLEGSLRAESSRIRVAANLLLAESGARLWSFTREQGLHDTRRAPEELAERLAGEAFEVMSRQLDETHDTPPPNDAS